MSEASDTVVILGAGHAGVQAAASLRDEGYQGRILLASDEKAMPYQRPPLSKAFLKGEMEAEGLQLRGPRFYGEKGIDLLLGEEAVAIDRATRRVSLASSASLTYGHLVLATGGRERPLPIEGATLNGVLGLRNLADAERLRERLATARSAVVVGAGFIGLEFAATAALKGCAVHVVEITARPMGRAISRAMSDFYVGAHRALGVDLRLETRLEAIEGLAGKVCGVRLADGRRIEADIVLVGIGILARDELARAAGLDCPNGVLVDDRLRTQDPHVSAIGDCAYHPNAYAKRLCRLESVQNANDQARIFAKCLMGKPERYDNLPWFWSDQADLKLQIAGLSESTDELVIRGAPEKRAFSVFTFRDGKLACVESVNRPGDHMAARRLIAQGMRFTPRDAADESVDLRAASGAARR
jgi:3-phenylpropionate/trans-cinnamate dioxygenase ferredoxin reductase component